MIKDIQSIVCAALFGATGAAMIAGCGTTHIAGSKWVDAVCPSDSVKVGTVCLDRYEASVWELPGADPAVIHKIRTGSITLAELQAAGAVQRGLTAGDYGCSIDGVGCAGKIFAVSLAGVEPSAFVTWFQSQQACANSLKRLPTNAEWQVAAAGTPDVGVGGVSVCNVGSSRAAAGGSPGCVSSWGAHDMVGNLVEWVADWTAVPSQGTTLQAVCPGWAWSYVDPADGETKTPFSVDDYMCFAGTNIVGDPRGPAALQRGGGFGAPTPESAMGNGPLAIEGRNPPWFGSEIDGFGFRCAR